MLLALIAQIKGCSLGYEILGRTQIRTTASEAEVMQEVAKSAAQLSTTQPWFHARTILLGAGGLCALLWFRNRIRQRAAHRNGSVMDEGNAVHRIRVAQRRWRR